MFEELTRARVDPLHHHSVPGANRALTWCLCPLEHAVGLWGSTFPSQTRKPLTSLFWQKNSQNCQEGPTAEALDAGKEISLSENAGLSGPLALCLGCWSGWRQWMVGDQRSQGHFVWCVPTPHFFPDGVMKWGGLPGCYIYQIHSTLWTKIVSWCLWGNKGDEQRDISYFISRNEQRGPRSD